MRLFIRRKPKVKEVNNPFSQNTRNTMTPPQITNNVPKVKHIKPIRMKGIIKYGRESVKRINQNEEKKSPFMRFFGL